MGTSPFTRIAAGAVAGLLIVGAVAAAGCGGGGSSTATTAAGTATTSTSTTTAISQQVPKSTPIASSDYVNALAQNFEQRGMSSSQADKAAHCVQDGLTKAGFQTQGDAEGPNAQKAVKIILPCVQKARAH